ncbi:MAG: metallophosphoesterase family protein [Clostridia bacterium]|nr:metallophosphoesterase family protein [Clostridia bacterium]
MKEHRPPRKPAAWGVKLASCRALSWLPPLRAARKLSLREDVVSGVPPALDGLKIAYASDVHYGAYLGKDRLRDLAERLNALEADVLILGGDYGEDAAHGLAFWEQAPGLHARLAVCAVLGNHDRAKGSVEDFSRAMRARGVTPLVNGALLLDVNGARLAVCATDDDRCGEPDLAPVLAQCRGADWVIYAPHMPDALQPAFAAAQPPFFHLALCGHTHGGQITVFGLPLDVSSGLGWRYGRRHLTGHFKENGRDVIVSNGVGVTWLPFRAFAPAQYHLITLRA